MSIQPTNLSHSSLKALKTALDIHAAQLSSSSNLSTTSTSLFSAFSSSSASQSSSSSSSSSASQSSSSSSSSASQTSELSSLQESAYQSLVYPNQSRTEVQSKIRALFVRMAEEMLPTDPEATLCQRVALDLTSDVAAKARLTMLLGNAYLKKTDRPSIQKAIKFYKDGAGLDNITPYQKAQFYLNCGHAYLIRKATGDEDKAIKYYNKALQINNNSFNLIGDLYISIGKAHKQKFERNESKMK